MNWLKEQLEKISDLGSLLFTIILDLGFVIAVAYATEKVKYIIEEYILHSTLESTKNYALFIVYTVSKISLISLAILYAIFDIIKHIIKEVKKLRKND